MQAVTLNVRFFGSLRRLGSGLDLSVIPGSGLAAFKAALCEALGDREAALIQDCALADDTRILAQDHVFTQDGPVCVLPPVCGG